MSPVTLSIITVNLNNKAGLEKTIKSVRSQSYRPYEFLLIDGGSQDGSTAVIDTYKDEFTYWVSEQDRGIYHAMNKGIQRAKGAYCLFLNSGDWLVNETVLATIFSTNPTADILIGRCRISEKNKAVFITQPAAELTLQSFIGSTLPHQATFIKRTLFGRFGLYEEKYRINADFAFWIRAIILGNCSTAALDVLVSDYNLEGISSRTEQNPDVYKDIPIILREHFPERVLQDYQRWLAEKRDQNRVYYTWLVEKKYPYGALKIAYKLARRVTKVLHYMTAPRKETGTFAE